MKLPIPQDFNDWKIWARELVRRLELSNSVAELAKRLAAGSGVTLTYDGQKQVITLAASGGGGGLDVLDGGVTILTPASALDFVGAGVSVTDAGGGTAAVSIPGGGTGIDVLDEGATIGGAFTALDFLGAGVSVVDGGGGIAKVTVPGTPAFSGALVEKTSNQSVTSSGAIASWDAAAYDTSGWWSGGSPTRLTVPSGVTRVRLSACCRTTTNNQNITGHMLKNGSDVFAGNPGSYSYSATGALMIVSAVLNVTAGDYFEVFYWPPTTLNLIGGTGRRSWFSVEAV